jgi:alpha-beta hydrolase superfamily lysophospholipase
MDAGTGRELLEQSVQTGVRGELHARLWRPADRELQGCIVIVHGLGEHGERYQGLAQRLAESGWATLTADLPGHGRSPGRRGHIRSYRGLLADISTMLGAAAAQLPGLPLVLLGHSMGGNLAANYILRRREIAPEAPEPVALVLSGPMFLPQRPPPRPHIFAAWLTGYLLPWWTVRAPVDTDRLTHNRDIVQAIREDPLMHNRLSLYLGTQLLAQGRHALDHADRLDLPTLVMHGEDDPITSYRASESFAIRAGSVAKFIAFSGMLHEIFHEPDRDRVFEALQQWLSDLRTV